MEFLRFGGTEFSVDPVHGCITSLTVGTIPLIAAESPLFTFCVRTPDAQTEEFSSMQGALCDTKNVDNALVLSYNGFGGAAEGMTVTLALAVVGDALESRVSVHNEGGNMVEWVGVLPLILPKLKGDGGGSSFCSFDWRWSKYRSELWMDFEDVGCGYGGIWF